MKINKYLKIAITILTISIVGCDDNLDIKPDQFITGSDAISSPENLTKLLNNAYGTARGSNSYGGSITLASELIANDGDIYWNGTYVEPAEFDEKAMLSDNFYVENIWMNAYNFSNQANIVLANLDKFTDVDEKANAEGGSKFLRGLAYFDMARLYSKPYTPGVANSQLAVPIVLEAVIDPGLIDYPSRNTLDEVYTQVITDLTAAYNLLPESNGIYAIKFSAAALLARVYLQMGNYEKARDWADEVINDSGASLTGTFAAAFNNDANSSEDLFAWQVTSQDASTNSNNTFWAGSDFGGRSGNPDVDVEDQHFNIYDDPNDERANFFYEADYFCTTKWKSQFANISFIRLAEMYLIRAESNFRLSTTIGDTPINDLNRLRNRSQATPLGTATLDVILMERRRELSFEGHALFDVKRLKLDVGDLPYDDNKLVMPIPLRETDANTNLEQNPGY